MKRGLNPAGRFLLVVVLPLSTPLVCLGLDSQVQKTSAMAISGAPQLFLDDELVCRMTNLKRVLKRPVKHPQNPVIVPEHPWEKRILELYGTVLFDPARDRYRGWYLANEFKDGIPDTPEHARTAEYYTCYAESEDGVRWTKPLAGAKPFGNYARHNVVIPDTHGFCVLPTPDDPNPRRRYKGAGGARFGFSTDGLEWDLRDWRPAVGKNDTSTCVVRWQGEYLAFVRAQVPDPNWSGVMRGVGLSRSKDFAQWTPKETVFATDDQDSYPWVQPYGLSVTPYGDVLVGILWLLHLDQVAGNNSRGSMDTQLVVSRDGRTWGRVADRAVFLAPTPGSWDAGRVFPGTTMVVKDDEIRVYYTGVTTRHGDVWGAMGIGLATLPADRFVALERVDAAQPGILETYPLLLPQADLVVNADIGKGNLEVELVEAGGSVLTGYGRAQSRLVRHDRLRYRVVWESTGEARSLRAAVCDQPVSLRFVIEGSSLYAFRVVP